MADGALSSFIFIAAALLLLHSSYSAYEFSYFVKHLSTSSLSHTEIPLDIKLEAGVGVLVATLGAIYKQSDKLKPIKFSKAIVESEVAGDSPFLPLERRTIFSDIQARRKEYSNWLEQSS